MHVVKIEAGAHLKAACPTNYFAGHKEEGAQKRKDIKEECGFVDKSITKALDSLDPSEMQLALNKFVAMATPDTSKIDSKAKELDLVVARKKLRTDNPTPVSGSTSSSSASTPETTPHATPHATPIARPMNTPFVAMGMEQKTTFLETKRAEYVKIESEIEWLDTFLKLDENEIDLMELGLLIDLPPLPSNLSCKDFLDGIRVERSKKLKTLGVSIEILAKKVAI